MSINYYLVEWWVVGEGFEHAQVMHSSESGELFKKLIDDETVSRIWVYAMTKELTRSWDRESHVPEGEGIEKKAVTRKAPAKKPAKDKTT